MTCPHCNSPARDDWPCEFRCKSVNLSGRITRSPVCFGNEVAQLRAKVKRLEQESADYMNLYCNWKAYATNLADAGQRMFDGGYHAPHVASEWREAMETRP